MNSQKLIFLHISKTAGTTLREIAIKNYGEEDTAVIYGTEEEKRTAFEAGFNQRKAMLFGHFDFSFLPENLFDYKVICFLRNPFNQMVSHYLHFARKKQEDLNDGNFLAFLRSYEGQNWQCQYLAGWRRQERALIDKDTMLKEALANLKERVFFCGITEQFDDSLLWLKSELGWKKINYQKRNMAQQTDIAEDLKQKFRSEILRANSLDMQLYEQALQLFESKIKEVDFLNWKRFFRKLT